MIRIHCWIGLLVGLVAMWVAAPPVAAQQQQQQQQQQQRPPSRDGLVLVEVTDGETVLGFATGEVAGGMRVVTNFVRTNVNASSAHVVVRDGDAEYRDISVLRYDDATGSAVLTVPGLTALPYPFASVPAVAEERVYGAILVREPTFVPGEIEEVRPDDPVSIRHTVVSPNRQNGGAPLVNYCGQVVGVIRQNPDVTMANSDVAVPAERLLGVFGGYLGQTIAGSPCEFSPEPATETTDTETTDTETVDTTETTDTALVPDPSEERVLAPAPDPMAEAAAAENALGLTRADRRLIQLGLASMNFNPGDPDGFFGDLTREAIREAQAARTGVAVTGYLDAELARDLRQFGEALTEEQQARFEAEQREAEEARLREESEQREAEEARLREESEQEEARLREEAARQRTQDRVRLIRWTGGAVAGGTALALLFWVFSRRSVANAARNRNKAEMLARSAQADLAEREAQERMASAVPAVFLDGADAAGEPVGVRVPGNAIAAAGGAIVGRNPFDSTVVLDHAEVSRGHFRLFARGTSVMVEDLNSTNGTKVNGVALTPGAGVPLDQGAVLQVGSVTLNVTLQA